MACEEFTYGCGHGRRDIIFCKDCSIAIIEYLDWRDSVGFKGDRSMCFDCYMDQLHGGR
jgi:hypothetical protein